MGIKRPRLTTHFYPVPRSKNEWNYTSTPQYVFMAWYLVKHRDKFTFTLNLSAASVARNFGDIRLGITLHIYLDSKIV
jgi:hypothetical protein